jgi:hypothetical protein
MYGVELVLPTRNCEEQKENFEIPPRKREEQKILLNFWKRTNKRLV